jgi:hypothetical protein
MSVRASDMFPRFLSKSRREGPDKPDIFAFELNLSGLSGDTLNIFFISNRC